MLILFLLILCLFLYHLEIVSFYLEKDVTLGLVIWAFFLFSWRAISFLVRLNRDSAFAAKTKQG